MAGGGRRPPSRLPGERGRSRAGWPAPLLLPLLTQVFIKAGYPASVPTLEWGIVPGAGTRHPHPTPLHHPRSRVPREWVLQPALHRENVLAPARGGVLGCSGGYCALPCAAASPVSWMGAWSQAVSIGNGRMWEMMLRSSRAVMLFVAANLARLCWGRGRARGRGWDPLLCSLWVLRQGPNTRFGAWHANFMVLGIQI